MPTLQFKGKTFVQNHHLAVKYHQLVPKKELSLLSPNGEGKGVGCSLHDNLIIHGDNLKALKALLPTYAGKIKCIYIDPPYNTGNENWVYNDNVNSPMLKEWLGKVVDKEDLTRHDKWLCMMMPRLKLLRELLSEDGAIFISIDDNEQHYLRCILDEVFGAENFVANIIWQKKYAASNDATGIAAMHDFVVVYQKTPEFNRNLFPRTDKQDKPYKFDDNDGKGLWRSDNLL
jgi:adenine-specific DNA-methyltransferase